MEWHHGSDDKTSRCVCNYVISFLIHIPMQSFNSGSVSRPSDVSMIAALSRFIRPNWINVILVLPSATHSFTRSECVFVLISNWSLHAFYFNLIFLRPISNSGLRQTRTVITLKGTCCILYSLFFTGVLCICMCILLLVMLLFCYLSQDCRCKWSFLLKLCACLRLIFLYWYSLTCYFPIKQKNNFCCMCLFFSMCAFWGKFHCLKKKDI